ncbi:phosphate--AMP phosphotransferase [Pelagicoccus albus]|uniref:Phosphate--AMP phosphotransferase n=1 Tax=Pelagicoccus albus TaxID=415222 RepID=A0A7X1B899_9BACT|nr:phosphate--AMP phosphotransferase [Pelagicoccus albus]MBC2606225.1 phosphate--AMP phosphotransferase [Pelagicoccus albus]
MSENTTDSDAHTSTKAQLKELSQKLGVVQREAGSLGIPSLVIVEGLDASMKGRLLNEVLLEIDSRSFRVYSTHAGQQDPRRYPLLHRFWNNTPAKGKIQFYDRGPYYLVLDSWAEGKLHEDELPSYWEDIVNFERQLHDSGVKIVKLFLNVSKKTQAKRFRKLEDNPKTAWRVTPKDWRRHRQYRSYLETAKQGMEATNRDYASWHTIDTENFKTALVDVYNHIIDTLENAIEEQRALLALPKEERNWVTYQGHNYLADTQFEEPMDRQLYKKTLKQRQEKIHELVHEIHSHELPVVIAFCGWDAAGKGGCIKRLVQSIDPRGYDVNPVAAPNQVELSHHYLWRFWKEMPPRGKIAIFDRSWYGRVLVERVEALCSNDDWQRAYREMNQMEEHLAKFGTTILKFWLHIDKDTQLERFEARQTDPLKNWKITDEDWRNREKWERYEESVNEMIEKTNTDYAPWKIIPANCKMRARLEVLDTVISSLKKAIKRARKAAL